MFLDRVDLTVIAGNGGNGAATFRREAHVPRGGPDGGDGGRGGSIYLVVDVGQTMLIDYRHKHHFRAQHGGPGQRARRHGKAGSDLELAVPPGTTVYDAASGDLMADLVYPAQRVMVARGGRGGLGNTHFATSTHQAPRHAQKGEPGEERRLRLELRLIADVGLVGLPNAGKSTLLRALTAATPKIAAYPFTTLEPNLGVLDLAQDDPLDDRRPTLADLPGLIEGASAGAGLGHAFLRHVERTRVLVHVVDMSVDDPERDYQVIREELGARDPMLLDKTTLVVANKMDLEPDREILRAFNETRAHEGLEVVQISAAERVGLLELRSALARLLPTDEELGGPGEATGVVVHRYDPTEEGYLVVRGADGVWTIQGRRVERLVAQTDFENEESATRFQRELARLGLVDKLRASGVEPGDTVRIGETELEWGAEPGAWL
ncbi:MAG: GTPase ObgE [Chloroflexota bacterium]|jgi:GTP-binding protein